MGTPVRCSFCGKSQNDVRHVIAGPLVYICDECVVLGAEIVREKSDALPFEAVGAKRAELRLRAFELLKGTGEIQADGSIKPHSMQMLMQNAEVLVGWALDAAPAREPAPCPAVVAEVCRLVLDAAKRIMSDQPQTPAMSAERLRWTETWRMLIDAVGLLNPAGCHPDDQPEVLRRIATLKGAGGDHA